LYKNDGDGMTTYMMAGAGLLTTVYMWFKQKEANAENKISNAIASFSKSKQYDSLIKQFALRYDIDPMLIKSLCYWESSFNKNSKGIYATYGLGQFNNVTWQEVWLNYMPNIIINGVRINSSRAKFTIGQVKDWVPSPFAPEFAIEAIALNIAWLKSKLADNDVLALAAHNAGLPRVLKAYSACIQQGFGRLGGFGRFGKYPAFGQDNFTEYVDAGEFPALEYVDPEIIQATIDEEQNPQTRTASQDEIDSGSIENQVTTELIQCILQTLNKSETAIYATAIPTIVANAYAYQQQTGIAMV
jgi:hypothetical protein